MIARIYSNQIDYCLPGQFGLSLICHTQSPLWLCDESVLALFPFFPDSHYFVVLKFVLSALFGVVKLLADSLRILKEILIPHFVVLFISFDG